MTGGPPNTVASAQTVLARNATNSHLCGPVRLAFWCWSHADEHGHAQARPGQLRDELLFASSNEVSRALRHARGWGLIDLCSSARCVVMSGHALAPCAATHRWVD